MRINKYKYGNKYKCEYTCEDKLTAGNNGVITQQMFHQPGCLGPLLLKITRLCHLWNDDIDDNDIDDDDDDDDDDTAR